MVLYNGEYQIDFRKIHERIKFIYETEENLKNQLLLLKHLDL